VNVNEPCLVKCYWLLRCFSWLIAAVNKHWRYVSNRCLFYQLRYICCHSIEASCYIDYRAIKYSWREGSKFNYLVGSWIVTKLCTLLNDMVTVTKVSAEFGGNRSIVSLHFFTVFKIACLLKHNDGRPIRYNSFHCRAVMMLFVLELSSQCPSWYERHKTADLCLANWIKVLTLVEYVPVSCSYWH